jgi:glycosyltransferase involved in cell wall biosynthesis
MKKILLISKLPPPYYGTTIWTQILLNSNLGKSFRLVHFNNNIHKSFRALGKPNFFTALANIVLYFKIIIHLFKEEPDLIFIPISQTTAGFLKDSVYVIIGKIFRKKILLILHGSDFRNHINRSSGIVQYYIRSVLKSSNGIVVLGENLKGLFKDFYSDDKIFVVPNGGNYIYPKRESQELVRLLYLANLSLSKGILDVIKSMVYLNKNGIKLVLNVVGEWLDEDIKNRCYELVDKNKIPVIFHGQITGEAKYQFLSNSDIFIFPPIAPEGHPYVIVEALAAGLPIISTNKGAIVESVKNGINGFIVDPEKPEQIAEKIEYLIKNPEICLAMSRESRRIYEENFTEGKMVERLTNVFNQILN